jgi:hypothetical protein
MLTTFVNNVGDGDCIGAGSEIVDEVGALLIGGNDSAGGLQFNLCALQKAARRIRDVAGDGTFVVLCAK